MGKPCLTLKRKNLCENFLGRSSDGNHFICCLLQERIPVEEVFEQLKCTRDGLTTEEGEKRLQIFGPNKLEEKEANSLCSRAVPYFHFVYNDGETDLLRTFFFFWKQESKLLKFLGFMWNPLSWVMEAAAIMAIVLANGGVITSS